MYKAWLVIITGAWLVLSGLVITLQTSMNLIISGIIIAIASFMSLKSWHSVAAGILGIWLIISGSLLSLWTPANYILSGTAAVILGGLILANSVDFETPENTNTY